MLEFFTAQINNGHTRRAYLLNGGSVENALPRRPIEVRHPIARRADEYLVLRKAVSDALLRPITSSQAIPGAEMTLRLRLVTQVG